jgi:hypothetical protein
MTERYILAQEIEDGDLIRGSRLEPFKVRSACFTDDDGDHVLVALEELPWPMVIPIDDLITVDRA